MDDMGLWNGMEEDTDILEVAAEAQESINTWGKSLISTGGDLRLAKCNYTIIDQEVDAKGIWKYKDEEKKSKKSKGTELEDDELDDLDPFEDITIGVPQVNVNIVAIKRLTSSEAVKT